MLNNHIWTAGNNELTKNAERKHSSPNTQLLVFLLDNSTVNTGASHNLLVGEESLRNISRMLVVS